MESQALQAQLRTETGKKSTKALRITGRIPASLYGPSREACASLSVERREVEKLVHGGHEHALINLDIEGSDTVRVLIKDHQAHRLLGHFEHVDFYEVSTGHKLITKVGIEVTGQAEGVKAGGVLERTVRNVTVQCLPKDLPEVIVVDITDLNIGDSIQVKDLPLPDGVTIRAPEPNTTLVHVIQSRVAASVAADEAAAESAVAEAAAPVVAGAPAVEGAPEEEQPEGGEG